MDNKQICFVLFKSTCCFNFYKTNGRPLGELQKYKKCDSDSDRVTWVAVVCRNGQKNMSYVCVYVLCAAEELCDIIHNT
jgi:hypothetical protein